MNQPKTTLDSFPVEGWYSFIWTIRSEKNLHMGNVDLKASNSGRRAIKIQRTSIAVLTAQIAAKVLHTMMLEEKILLTEEKLKEARVNSGALITDHSVFIKNLLIANQELDVAKESLVLHQKEVEFLKAELEIAKS